jgi:SAM-dependent methyltransferase
MSSEPQASHGDTLPPELSGDVQELYARRFPDKERRAKAELWRTLYDAFFSRYVRPGACVLDVGAGYCDFINNVQSARRIAVDINPEVERHAAAGVEVHRVELSRIAEVVAPATVDLAFASNVFEHLRGPAALLGVLRAIHAVLKAGGRLVIMQPNIRHVGAAFWDFFDHTLPLTEKGMAEALGVAGFEILELRPQFLPYTTVSRLPQWSLLVRTYLAVRPLHRLFGKQMLVVARRT